MINPQVQVMIHEGLEAFAPTAELQEQLGSGDDGVCHLKWQQRLLCHPGAPRLGLSRAVWGHWGCGTAEGGSVPRSEER